MVLVLLVLLVDNRVTVEANDPVLLGAPGGSTSAVSLGVWGALSKELQLQRCVGKQLEGSSSG